MGERVGGGGRWLKGEGGGAGEDVEERGRTLNPRDSVFGFGDSCLIRATGPSDIGITSDSGFEFWTRKSQP